MLSVARAIIIPLLFFCMPQVVARDLYILNLQENGSKKKECINQDFIDLRGIYRIDQDGFEQAIAKPLSPVACLDERLFFLLSRFLIDKGQASRVIFLTVTQDKSGLNDWFNNGVLQKKLTLAIETTKAKNIKFDYAFWQGAFTSQKLSANYFSDIRKVMKAVSLKVPVEKWLISNSVPCDLNERKPRTITLVEPLLNRFSGPDINSVIENYQNGTCQLNDVSENKLAKLWANHLILADEESLKYQKESLLFYFKSK